MTHSVDQDSDSPSSASELSDDLPPVQPPSAGFIVQLFVVPGLIVLAVVVVWALFGRIAAGEQDWRTLVQDLQSQNEHLRKRAMYGLAQLLEQDRRRGKEGQNLAGNTEIATTLCDLLTRELRLDSHSQESVAFQQYLTRAVGWLDTPQLTMAPLRKATEATRDIEIRKSGVYSIAVAAGRAQEAGLPLDDPETVKTLVELSNDSVPVMRHASAFALGFFPSPEADQQLHVLLGADEWLTSVNAAIALARQQSTDGLPVFKKALSGNVPEKQEALVEYFAVLTNSLTAISRIAPKMDEADKKEFRELLQKLVNDHTYVRIRVDAQNALSALQ